MKIESLPCSGGILSGLRCERRSSKMISFKIGPFKVNDAEMILCMGTCYMHFAKAMSLHEAKEITIEEFEAWCVMIS